MKRIAAALIASALLIPAASANASVPPELSATSAVLVDGESGRVLFEKNAHEMRSIASITKLMTALVAVEHTPDLKQEVTVRPEWTGIEGSSIYLRAGETVTLETLLYGLLLNSGNDAAVALAEVCAGSVETFVEWMNVRADALGMEHTQFMNPNGLSEEGHYSTAYDMALMACACSQNETIREITATKSITLGSRTFSNHNKLLWLYDGCFGMKTGYTELSGRTLISAARRDGQTLIAVTLNAPNDWCDHSALLDYGFEVFPERTLCAERDMEVRAFVQGSLVPFVGAVTANEVRYPLAEHERAEAKIALKERIEAPVAAGTVLGTVSFYLENQPIGETSLIAAASANCDVAEPQNMLERIRGWFGKV